MINQTALLTDVKKIEIVESPMPICRDDDVVIEVKHVGVCGSDVGFFVDPTAGGLLDTKLPIILGHEVAGIVVEVGKDVKEFSVGDRVALEPGVPCGKCEYCLEGRYNLCDEMIFMAAPPFKTGALSKYIRHPAFMTYKLPDHMTTLEGALLEPFAVGMHAVNRSGITYGKTALIIGSGCIGMMVLQACKTKGIKEIIIADLFDNRLQKASELGAKYTVNSGELDLRDEVKKLTNGKGADVVFETAGNPFTAAMTPELVKKGGKIVFVGNITKEIPLLHMQLNMNEVDILSVFRYHGEYPLVLNGVSTGTADVEGIVTNTFKFEDVQKAFECALYDKKNALKVAIEF